jgi:hypothetical protein
MQEQPRPGADPGPGRIDAELDNLVLGLLLDGPPWLWSVDEVGRELDDRVGVQDAIARLGAAGLLHRLGDFVFASRSAHRACELHAGTI